MNKNRNGYEDRLGLEKYNHQGCLMKIIEYRQYNDIIVEFQDEYKAKVHTAYNNFEKGSVRNPYYKSVYEVGMIGVKYPSRINNKQTKEYITWSNMLKRCFDDKYKKKNLTYKNVSCCDKWLIYENFYEWLHSQENFDKWLNGSGWDLDKDILVKGNKVYSPETCCLVPNNVNKLFAKCNISGSYKRKDRYEVYCNNPFLNKMEYLGVYSSKKESSYAYKSYKEKIIKQVAQIEYSKGNITKGCYEAMMNYEIEVID